MFNKNLKKSFLYVSLQCLRCIEMFRRTLSLSRDNTMAKSGVIFYMVPEHRNSSMIFLADFLAWLNRARRVTYENVVLNAFRLVKISEILIFLN